MPKPTPKKNSKQTPTSKQKIRDMKQDNLLTPENSVLVLIDYQPIQINSVNSMARETLLRNISAVAAAARLYKIPTVLTTVNARGNPDADTVPIIKNTLPAGTKSYDRTTVNSWEDVAVNTAIKNAARKKIIMCALWTEACLSFPTLDALADGFEVYVIADAVGGTSVVSHKAALHRMEQAGAKITSVAQVLCELQRDWARTETVPGFVRIMTDAGIFLNMGK